MQHKQPPLPVVAFPGSGGGWPLLPPVTADSAVFYDALAFGRIELQACSGCDRLRYPIAPVCPWCGVSRHVWRSIAGIGVVHSWVRYRRTFVPAFESLVPYVVLTVQLDEGPRMVGRLAADCEPRTGMPVSAVIERWEDGAYVPAFVTVGVGAA